VRIESRVVRYIGMLDWQDTQICNNLEQVQGILLIVLEY